MTNNSYIQSKEELEFEKGFSLFSFSTQWMVYFIFFLFPIEINSYLLASGICFSIFRFIAIARRVPNSKIYLWNHLSSISLLLFFTTFFISISKNDVHGFLNWQFYYFALSFTIVHESMRVHKHAYLLISVLSIIFYTIVVFTVKEFETMGFAYKFLIPYLFIVYCTCLGYYINQSRREAIRYYTDLLQDKILISRDMELARTVHESLFPKIKSIKGLKFDIFRKSHNQIGGDFYDFIQLREGNIGIFITDVAGHGYSSAMVAAMLKVMVSTLPYYLKLDPTGLLNYIDQKISGEFKSHHATALYLFINFINKNILLGNAGHPYLIYAKKNEDFKEIETFGTLLGFGLHDPVAVTLEMKYETGDRFFIYTDGLIENINSKNELLESDGLLKILNQCKNEKNLTDIKESIISKINSHYGKTDFSDDAMFLIFEIE